MNKYNITTNDGTGQGDRVNHFVVEAESESEAIEKAYYLIHKMDEFDTIVVYARLIEDANLDTPEQVRRRELIKAVMDAVVVWNLEDNPLD